MKILVINPGSTSTKIAVYENETPLLVRNIKHTVEELSVYPQVIDQFEFRKNLVLQELEANGIPLHSMLSSDAAASSNPFREESTQSTKP